jgi:hypothetical protein
MRAGIQDTLQQLLSLEYSSTSIVTRKLDASLFTVNALPLHSQNRKNVGLIDGCCHSDGSQGATDLMPPIDTLSYDGTKRHI